METNAFHIELNLTPKEQDRLENSARMAGVTVDQLVYNMLNFSMFRPMELPEEVKAFNHHLEENGGVV